MKLPEIEEAFAAQFLPRLAAATVDRPESLGEVVDEVAGLAPVGDRRAFGVELVARASALVAESVTRGGYPALTPEHRATIGGVLVRAVERWIAVPDLRRPDALEHLNDLAWRVVRVVLGEPPAVN